MSNFKSIHELEKILTPIVEGLGMIFVDIDLKKISGELTLTVYIDKKDGVTIDDCELVSKAIDEAVDEFDITNGESYNQNVSSPGLDRQLKKPVDFERNLGKEIEVKFFAPFEGKKIMKGELISYTADNFVIKAENKEVLIETKLTAKISPVIKF